jgi:hypothetical protein
MVADFRAAVRAINIWQRGRYPAIHQTWPGRVVGGPGLHVVTGGTQVADSDSALVARRPDYGLRRVIALITSSAPERDLFFEVGDGHHTAYTGEV